MRAWCWELTMLSEFATIRVTFQMEDVTAAVYACNVRVKLYMVKLYYGFSYSKNKQSM